MLSRRLFLLGSGAFAGLSAASCSGASIAAPPATGQRNLRSIGLNLAPIADSLAQSPTALLRAVSTLGFQQVELAGRDLLAMNHKELRRVLDGEGLSAPAVETSLDEALIRPERVVAMAKDVGASHIVLPAAPRRLRSSEGLASLVDFYNSFGLRAGLAGIGCSFRHTAAEFAPAASTAPGETVLDYLLDRTDPSRVNVELDLYWTAHARLDLPALFDRHAGRFQLVHASDMGARGARVAMGAGLTDFGSIFAASDLSGMEHVFLAPFDGADMSAAASGYLTLAALRY